jgi:tetrahydromethanopterin S-methyltransferase subunit F
MAQRDDGLDKLEAFIAAAAETRANLQRDAERMSDVCERLEEYLGDVEARLTELDDAIEAFDARYGDQVVIVMAVAAGLYVGTMSAGLGPIGFVIGVVAAVLAYWMLNDLRVLIVNGCDLAIAAYRALGEDSARLRPVLAEAGEEAEQAFDAFCAAAAQALAAPGRLLEEALHA